MGMLCWTTVMGEEEVREEEVREEEEEEGGRGRGGGCQGLGYVVLDHCMQPGGGGGGKVRCGQVRSSARSI